MKNILISILSTVLVFLSLFAAHEYFLAQNNSTASIAVREGCEYAVAQWLEPAPPAPSSTGTGGDFIMVGGIHRDQGAPAPTFEFNFGPEWNDGITINCLDYFPNLQ